MARMVSTRGLVVEQHAAAAVHLGVDESGQQRGALEVVPARALHARIGRVGDRGDAPALEQHRVPLDEAPVGKDAAIDEGLAIRPSR